MVGGGDASRDFLLAFYQALTVTLTCTACYAGYKIVKNPRRYNYCFYSAESRRHAVAGCLLTALLTLPVLANLLNPVAMTAIAMLYTFGVVPVASGLYGATTLRRLQRRLRFCRLWLDRRFRGLLTSASEYGLVLVVAVCSLPQAYGASKDLQSRVSEVAKDYWPLIFDLSYCPL